MSPLLRILIVLVAAGAAIGAAILLRSATSTSAAAIPATLQPETVERVVEVSETEVLVAARQLRVGEVTNPGDFVWAKWPEATVNPNHYLKDVSPDAMDELSGMVVRQAIYENEPVLPQRLVERGDTGVLAALVSPGMRAVSMEISAETASGGFILPDDRVDVILTHEVERFTKEGVVDEIQSVIIIENARVLAIDQGVRTEEGVDTAIGSTATLELAPDDAALIAFGERKGILSLVLRSLTDAALAGDEVISRAEDFAAGSQSGQVTVFRNGRVRESSAGAGGE